MQSIKSAFWNTDQRRIRALWRLMGQLVLLAVFGLPLQIASGVVGIQILLARGDVTSGQLSNPQAVQQLLLESPILTVLLNLASVAAFAVSIWMAGRFLDRRRFADFGFRLDRNWWIDLAFGLFLGALLMGIVFLVELAAGWVTVSGTFATGDLHAPFPLAVLSPLIGYLAVGFYEELLFRGYQLQNMAEGLNFEPLGERGAILLATMISSVLFGLAHLLNPNADVFSTFNIFLAGGLLLGLGYLLTGELAIPIGVHVTWNFFQGNVFGFLVSGTRSSPATFIRLEQAGPTLWTGGAFGPEGGLLGLAAILLGGLLTVLWVRWRYGTVGLHRALAEPPGPPEEEPA